MAIGVRGVVLERLLLRIDDLLVARSRECPVKLAKLPRRAQLPAARFGLGSQGRSLKVMREYGRHLIPMLEFSYTSKEDSHIGGSPVVSSPSRAIVR